VRVATSQRHVTLRYSGLVSEPKTCFVVQCVLLLLLWLLLLLLLFLLLFEVILDDFSPNNA